MTTAAQKAATAKYDKENTVRMSLKFNKNTDSEILERLNQVNSKQGYIRELIRRDIEADKGYVMMYEIIKISIDELNKEFSKPAVNLDYETVFTSPYVKEIFDKLKELNADDDTYSVESHEATLEGDFSNGSDFDTPSNFIKHNSFRFQ